MYIESLNASSPSEWVNQLELGLEIAEEEILSSLITLVDKGGMTLIKGSVELV